MHLSATIFYMNYKKTKFSTISNILFFLSTTFCLVFLWCNYSTKNLKTSLFSSIIIVVSGTIILVPIVIYRHKKLTTKSEALAKLDNFKLSLAYSQSCKVINFIKEIFAFEVTKKLGQNHYLVDNKQDLFCIFSESISIDQLQEIISSRKTDSIILISLSKPKIPVTLKDIKIVCYDFDYLSKYADVGKTYLDDIALQKKPKYSLKDIVCIVFNKKRSKSYFWLGLVLLFSSLFTPFSTYYIIFSTLFLLLSLICRFSGLFRLSD